MAEISIVDNDVELDEPYLVEGFPGVGLVGKITADHMVQTLDLTHYANVHCEGIPPIATYNEGTTELSPPVRLYANGDGTLLVLQSDVPIEPKAATAFADCFSPWLEDEVIPLFIAGLPSENPATPPKLFGVSTGEGAAVLEETDLDVPLERGVVTGPTGALLGHALEEGLQSVGLIVESDPQFPDPTASRVVLEKGIEPITGIDVSVGELVDRAEEIQRAKEQLAQQMQQGGEEASKAKPLRMYQ